MFALQFIGPTNGFNDRQRIAAEMLTAGVAFQRDGTTWDVISHEGDHMGTMSTFVATQTANMLRKAGLKNDGLRDYGGHPFRGQPSHDQRFTQCLSFGRSLRWPEGVLEEIMDRRFRNPVNLV